MRKVVTVLIIALWFFTPVAALDFEEASFSDDGVTVYAQASAEVPWESPFNEDVTMSVSVWPSINNLTWTTISSILVTVHSDELDGSFSFIASEVYDFSPNAEGVSHVNTSVIVTLAGSGIGSHCYLAVLVVGQYGNATDTVSYEASSSENLLGPFSISYGPTSPQFLFGVAMIGVFTIVMVLGMIGVGRSRRSPKREALLKDYIRL